MEASSDERYVTLHNGVRMPRLGLGTSHNGGYSHEAVIYALKECGYRLIDTAKRYGCEERLGAALKESGVPREEVFLTTKLWPSDYGTERTRPAFFNSKTKLNVEYIDLYMMHAAVCPSSCIDKRQTREDTWRQLEMLLDDGLVKAIGVSNFSIDHLEEMLDYCGVRPHVNQVEFHPYQNPSQLHQFCVEKGIQIEGYCPLAKGRILQDAPILKIASTVQRTPAQALIRWSIQKNVVTIPMSTKLPRVLENNQVFDFTLSEEDMKILDGLHDGRRIVNLDFFQDKVDNPLPDGYKLNLIQHKIIKESCYRRSS